MVFGQPADALAARERYNEMRFMRSSRLLHYPVEIEYRKHTTPASISRMYIGEMQNHQIRASASDEFRRNTRSCIIYD